MGLGERTVLSIDRCILYPWLELQAGLSVSYTVIPQAKSAVIGVVCVFSPCSKRMACPPAASCRSCQSCSPLISACLHYPCCTMAALLSAKFPLQISRLHMQSLHLSSASFLWSKSPCLFHILPSWSLIFKTCIRNSKDYTYLGITMRWLYTLYNVQLGQTYLISSHLKHLLV